MLRLFWLLSVLLLAACSAGHYAPVVDVYGQQSRPDRKVTSGTHVVKKGETLYAIAWRYGWDFRALARANGIGSPYTIYPGQRISLALRSPATASSTAPSQSGGASSKPSATPAPKPAASSSRSPANPSASAGGVVRWQWPASGKVVTRFSASSNGRQGIAIAGAHGSPVLAASAGKVVYRGSGLTGYGNLIIVKHDSRWLSAYAHNDRMLVKEGDTVKSGQKIATLGDSGTFRSQLHFEIRRDGDPVDPLRYLPKK